MHCTLVVNLWFTSLEALGNKPPFRLSKICILIFPPGVPLQERRITVLRELSKTYNQKGDIKTSKLNRIKILPSNLSTSFCSLDASLSASDARISAYLNSQLAKLTAVHWIFSMKCHTLYLCLHPTVIYKKNMCLCWSHLLLWIWFGDLEFVLHNSPLALLTEIKKRTQTSFV